MSWVQLRLSRRSSAVAGGAHAVLIEAFWGGRARDHAAPIRRPVFALPIFCSFSHLSPSRHLLFPSSSQGRTAAGNYCSPVCGLPRQDEGGGQDGIRRLAREGANGFVQAAQGHPPVLKSHAADERAVGEKGDMHGGEGE